ncbi:uncharacterized protein B0H18DRAFT_1064909 [Fomitopsis serialis]|uniref:uncharacterized protein n=1 Tax=Fomitopsis serialis TaxID=139415 RepID=UPI0020081FFE|nr:uncharacterized protein B0H18DRAFT_1064909 [Neoantrodia serialis]KAH9911008.1 hypothetical protein B0H18DRAFT_1064909 [Neoantrodia serialis]
MSSMDIVRPYPLTTSWVHWELRDGGHTSDAMQTIRCARTSTSCLRVLSALSSQGPQSIVRCY